MSREGAIGLVQIRVTHETWNPLVGVPLATFCVTHKPPALNHALDAVVGQHGVDRVGDGLDQVAQELGCFHLACAFHEAGECELAGAVDAHEQPQLALCRADFGDVDVEVTDWVGFEPLLVRLVALGFGQTGDAVALQATVQAGPGQRRDSGLEGIQAVVERQQRVPAEGDDGRFLLGGEHGRAGLLGSHCRVGRSLAPAPFLDGGWADAVGLRQRPYAFLAPLYRTTHCLSRCGAAVENLAHSSSLAAWRLSVPPHRGTEHLALTQVGRDRIDGHREKFAFGRRD